MGINCLIEDVSSRICHYPGSYYGIYSKLALETPDCLVLVKKWSKHLLGKLVQNIM